MRPMKTLSIVTTILVALMVGAAPAAAAPPKFTEDKDKIVLENDHVKVWFQGKKPMLKVMPVAGGEGYEYQFTDVVEYRDIDGDGGPSNAEIVSSLKLNSASDWVVTQETRDGAVLLNLTLTAPVKLGRDMPGNLSVPEGDANVSLLFTIHGAAKTINASGIDVSVPATSIKYDFVVTSWPFLDAAANRLALETKVHGDIELENETAVEGAQVLANGTAIGALSWTTLAVGNTTQGETVDVPVRAAIAMDGENMTRISYTYDAPDLASLVHDPTVGVTPTAESVAGESDAPKAAVPAAGALVAVATIGAVAVTLRMRR